MEKDIKRFELHLPVDIYTELKLLANSEHKTLSGFVRDLLIEEIKRANKYAK